MQRGICRNCGIETAGYGKGMWYCSFRCRLLVRVVRRSDDECWPPVPEHKSRNVRGYPTIIQYSPRKHIAFARAIWLCEIGPVPDGMLVCHHCDNRECANPSHLFLGTPQDNMDDMWGKGRGKYPPAHDRDTTIRKRFAAGDNARAIARECGLHKTTVYRIVRRAH